MRKRTAELPPLTTELVLVGTWLQVRREEHGARWCFVHGIGQMRRTLFASGALSAARKAKEILKGLCEQCPHQECPMKRWGVTAERGLSHGKWAKTKTAKT